MRHLSIIAISAAAALAGCVQTSPPNRVSAPAGGNIAPPQSPQQYGYGAPQPGYDSNAYDSNAYDGYGNGDAPPEDPNAGIYIDPPLDQPPPVRVEWAPPPLLDEPMPPPPYPDAIWTGGYWVWQDNWVWARGRWLAPPRPDYRWVRPYYEHRGNSVIFINGFWARPGVSFRRPPPTLNIPYARVRPGVTRGPRPNGPEGSFMPSPHGARRGSFVPAPLPVPQAARPPERRPPQSEPPRTREPLPAAPVRSSPDRPYEPGTQMRPDRSPQDRGQERDRRDQGRGQDRTPDRDRDQNRGTDRDQPRPQAITPPSPSSPRQQPSQAMPARPGLPDRPDRARPENGARGPSPSNVAERPPQQQQRPQADRNPGRMTDRNADRNPAVRPPQIQHPPSAQPPQAQPRPQAVPQAQRPAPQPRPEHRAPPRADPPAAPAPAQREGRERGNRDR